MVTILSLWIPILLSAVVVFFASFVAHMLLKHHKNDFKILPNEDAFLDAMRKLDIAPGDYLAPCVKSMKDMKSPEFVAKRTKGPIVIMTVLRGAAPSMGRELSMWFLYCLVVGVFAAYVTGRALTAGAPYLQVMRFAGVTAFACYSMALLQGSIWYKRNLGATLRTMFDGLVYALLTGGVFGCFWPGR